MVVVATAAHMQGEEKVMVEVMTVDEAAPHKKPE
jgi:hypothetical protein